MSERTLSVLDGSTFVVGDRLGDVRADEGREHGFFCEDTRFLSRWVLRVGETPLELLGLDQSSHFAAQLFLTPRVGPDEQAPCSIMRRRLIDHVWMEEVTVTNHRHETSDVRVALEIDADFADLFEVKDGAVAERVLSCRHDDRALTLAYERGGLSALGHDRRRAARRRSPARASPTRSTLAPGEQWSATLHRHAPRRTAGGQPSRGARREAASAR